MPFISLILDSHIPFFQPLIMKRLRIFLEASNFLSDLHYPNPFGPYCLSYQQPLDHIAYLITTSYPYPFPFSIIDLPCPIHIMSLSYPDPFHGLDIK